MFRRKSQCHRDQEEDVQKHEAKIAQLRVAIGQLSDRASRFCTHSCLRRYLEARNWHVDKSKKLLEESLKWRATYKPEEIRWPDVAVEGETGKVFRANFRDRQGRTVLIMRPAMQNTKSIENQLKHLVYLIENAILNLPDGQEQSSWLIDFTGWTMSNSVPIKSARETSNILQNHYPERLAVAFLYNPPRIFETFWKVCKLFLDPKTIHKVKFVYPKNKESVEVMKTYFDNENLPTEFGGQNTLKYDYEEFSRLMTQDDIKTAAYWGLEKKAAQQTSKAQAAPEPPTGMSSSAIVAPEPLEDASPPPTS